MAMMDSYRYVRASSVVVCTNVNVCSENIFWFNVGDAEGCRSVGGGRSIERVKTGVRQTIVNISSRKNPDAKNEDQNKLDGDDCWE